jgi:hypothetical protein
MASTYQILYENEIRNISISLHKQDNTTFTPTSASTFEVINSSGTTVIDETYATVSDNVVTATINTTVTGTAGNYSIKWKIIDAYDRIYYHKTILDVMSLFS